MAYSTHYLGHIKVTPPLNDVEYQYLTAFAETPHVEEDAGPYVVDDNPLAPRPVGPDGYAVLNRRDDVPDVACCWVPSCHGECLVINRDHGEHRAAAEWLQWLVDHFLKPAAHASATGLSEFEGFTFNHSLDAAVAAHRSDSGRLWLIHGDGHDVYESIVWPGEYAY